MCGYCHEKIIYEMLEAERRNERPPYPLSDNLFAHLYLQEADDPLSALEEIAKAVRCQKVVPAHAVSPETLVCRALEIMLEYGFDSPVYQGFLKNRQFRLALASACSENAREEMELAAECLGMKHLPLLYDPRTYVSSEHAAQLRLLAPLKDECHRMLRHYIRWWLRGDGLLEEDSGGYAEEDLETFSCIFRAIWFSLLFLGRYRSAKSLLLEVVTTNPAKVPSFDGMDLWLQRKSVLLLYDLERFNPFLTNIDKIRGVLMYFLDLKRALSKAKKFHLLKVIRYLPGEDVQDNLCFSLMEWLIEELEAE